ncbi:HNH endonuclease [bacterium]|jgi:5-methylcytosine-specific restriction endonuclease McrA|nr:HNH endonuclease [bacterium]
MSSTAGTGALDASVLVLNRLYMAIHVISVKRAFTLLCKELAEVVHIDDEGVWNSYNFDSWRDVSALKSQFKEPYSDWIRTVSLEIEVPRIIRLHRYDRIPKQPVKFNRRNIFARDENRCQYCSKKFPTSELTLDHVLPRSQGGQTTWENIVCACVSCNVRKGGRTPEQAHVRLIRKPVRPKTSPALHVKLGHRKYHSWKTFLDNAYWSVELK